jgi:2-phospho-L-lactate guanylyltransferase (CobY/MobA/RfbA family)
MSASWNTKYGSRKVRHDPPTLAEAIAAAQGLSDDPTEQMEIAAGLMDLPLADVKAEMQKMAPDRRAVRLVTAPSRDKGLRTVVVERKVSRRMIAKPGL